MQSYAVGFARPDRWSWNGTPDPTPWHAVAVDRPARDLDGAVEAAVCGAIVQIWGSPRWERMGAGRTACPECVRVTAAAPAPPAAAPVPAEPAAPVPSGRQGPLLRAV